MFPEPLSAEERSQAEGGSRARRVSFPASALVAGWEAQTRLRVESGGGEGGWDVQGCRVTACPLGKVHG